MFGLALLLAGSSVCVAGESIMGAKMTGLRCRRLAAASLTALFVLLPGTAQSPREKGLDSGQAPALVNTCLITKDVK
jgi:hypothetical protein